MRGRSESVVRRWRQVQKKFLECRTLWRQCDCGKRVVVGCAELQSAEVVVVLALAHRIRRRK
jgi:hypothetical protein